MGVGWGRREETEEAKPTAGGGWCWLLLLFLVGREGTTGWMVGGRCSACTTSSCVPFHRNGDLVCVLSAPIVGLLLQTWNADSRGVRTCGSRHSSLASLFTGNSGRPSSSLGLGGL